MGIDGGSLPSLYTPLPPIPGALESYRLCSPAYFSLLCLRLATLYLCVRLMSSFVLVHIVAYHSVSRLAAFRLYCTSISVLLTTAIYTTYPRRAVLAGAMLQYMVT